MTGRRWGATGVGKSLPVVCLSEIQRKAILDCFVNDIQLNDQNGFLEGVERAIHLYQVARRLAEDSSPSAVRTNLASAKKAALALADRMNALDGNSWQLLREVAPDTDLRATLTTIVHALHKAGAAAKQYPTVGRHPEDEKQYLAAELRHLFEKHTGQRVTAFKSGLFVGLLNTVMTIATGKPSKDLHTLAETALREDSRVEVGDGLVEYSATRKNRPRKTVDC